MKNPFFKFPWLPEALTGLVVTAIIFSGMIAIQFASPDLADNDGFYHIRLAAIMRETGLKPDFPWLPLTILNPREFYDHHFLFHVALIPFTFGDLRLGAKWAAVLFGSLAILSLYGLFRRQQLPYASWWAAGGLAVSAPFLYRLSIPRAQALSLLILVLALILLLERRYRWLGVLAFIYVWLYNAFPLILVIAAVDAAAVWLVDHRLEWRPLLYTAGGVALGLLVNPYFPFDLVFAYRHFLPKLTDATAVRVGSEWYPYTTAQVLENSPLALIALALGGAALGLNPRPWDRRTATAFGLTLIFAAMFFQARRFVEYFPPFALIFCAFAWAPLLASHRADGKDDSARQGRLSRLFNRAWLARLAFSLVLAAGLAYTLPQARQSMQRSKPYDLYAEAAAWLQANTPPGVRVFQTDWDDFPRLFFYNTSNTYTVGLDPTYLQLADQELFDTWVRITRGEVERPSQVILTYFGARYVHSDLNHTAFLEKAETDPGLQEVYRDAQAVIFQVSLP